MLIQTKVAVLLPAFNPGDRLRATLLSLDRNAVPHDIFIIDDGSEIPIVDLLDPLPENSRIIRLSENLGITPALNAGLREILQYDYTYIARIDAGDIAHPARLRRQVEFLDSHADVGLVGTWARFIGEDGVELFRFCPPISHREIKNYQFLNAAFVHSSFLIPTEVFRTVGLYDESYADAQDYELAQRIGQRYCLANLPECLIDYVVVPSGLSVRRRRRQILHRLRTQFRYFDATRFLAYYGVLRSVALLLTPVSWLTRLKVVLGNRQGDVNGAGRFRSRPRGER